MLRLSLALCLLSAAALALTRPDATEPSRFAIKHLSESLRESFPSLNQSFADEVARQQLRWIIRNPNATDYEAVREPRPMFAECPELPARSPPTNIKDLHPQDVKVMGAVGDSISTGCNALSSTWLNLKDYQGLAWSMGGDAGAVTLLNLMRQYNPEIVGASTGTGSGNTGLNHAKNGAVVQDVPGQVDALIANMQAREDVDFENDWKVVTLLIGGNNLCIVCKADKEKENNAEVYEHYLRESLQKLSTLPRTLVNVVQHTVYTQLAQFKGPLCGLVLPSVCDCLTTTNAAKQQAAEKAIVEFNEAGVKVAAEFQRRDDFAVVIQPFLEKTVIPDNSWISTADCFHPSGEGQRLFATGLWNGMLTPVPKKADYTAAIDDVPMCADADTLLYN